MKLLGKAFMISAAVLMMGSVGATSNTLNVNARHVRTHRIHKHNARKLRNYYHKKYVHKYNVYKMHHRKHIVSKAEAYKEGKYMTYKGCLDGTDLGGGSYVIQPFILKRLGINKSNINSYESGLDNEVMYIQNKHGSLFGKNIHRPFKHDVYAGRDGIQSVIFGFRNNKATKKTVHDYIKAYNELIHSKSDQYTRFDNWFQRNYNQDDKSTTNQKRPLYIKMIIQNKHNKKSTAEVLFAHGN